MHRPGLPAVWSQTMPAVQSPLFAQSIRQLALAMSQRYGAQSVIAATQVPAPLQVDTLRMDCPLGHATGAQLAPAG